MASSITNSPLSLLRRHKTKKQPKLHTRWGDVEISAPTEGAWSQFNNPHKREPMKYGPGFVPGIQSVPRIQDELDLEDYPPEFVEHIWPISDHQLESATPLSRSSTRSTSSTSLSSVELPSYPSISSGSSRSRRLTRIFSPHAASIGTTDGDYDDIKKKSHSREARQRGQNVQEPSSALDHPVFEYKPVKPNYAAEVAQRIGHEKAPRFHYVSASENLRRGLDENQPCRSSPRVPHSWRPSDKQRHSEDAPTTAATSFRVRSRSCEPGAYDRQPRGVQEVGRMCERFSSVKISRHPHVAGVTDAAATTSTKNYIPNAIQEEECVSYARGRQRTKDVGSARQAPSLRSTTTATTNVVKRSKSVVQPRPLMTTKMVNDEEDDLWWMTFGYCFFF